MAVVRGWLIGLGIAAAVMVATWGLLILLARRLPEGTAKELARFLPACVTTVRRLRAHPAVPRRGQLAGGVARLWGLSPIRPLPPLLPVPRPPDDVRLRALPPRHPAP